MIETVETCDLQVLSVSGLLIRSIILFYILEPRDLERCKCSKMLNKGVVVVRLQMTLHSEDYDVAIL